MFPRVKVNPANVRVESLSVSADKFTVSPCVTVTTDDGVVYKHPRRFDLPQQAQRFADKVAAHGSIAPHKWNYHATVAGSPAWRRARSAAVGCA